MEKTAVLKDGTEVVIRPLQRDDFKRSAAFFRELPVDDRRYLRRNITVPGVVEQRILDMEMNRVKRLVVAAGDKIVADGALELEGSGWKGHIGEIRLIVAKDYQRKGLGLMLASELFSLASNEKVEELVVKIMQPQVAARKIVEKLGFKDDITLTNYVKDMQGERHNLIVMRCDLKSAWQALEEYLSDSDWERRK